MHITIHDHLLGLSVTGSVAQSEEGRADVDFVVKSISGAYRRHGVFHGVSQIIVSVNLDVWNLCFGLYLLDFLGDSLRKRSARI